MLESRWVSSSKEILTFRKALMNPVTSHQFRRFVSIKGDNLENDVLFWQEVQKYKVGGVACLLLFSVVVLLVVVVFRLWFGGPVWKNLLLSLESFPST